MVRGRIFVERLCCVCVSGRKGSHREGWKERTDCICDAMRDDKRVGVIINTHGMAWNGTKELIDW